jgi:predicted PurR-regulated permease PerM
MSLAPSPIRFSNQAKLIAVAVIVGVTLVFFHEVEHILAPFIAAIITAYVFGPLVGLLQRRVGLHRAFWIAALYVLAFAMIYGFFTAFWPRFVQQVRGLASMLPALALELRQFFEGREQIELFGGVVIDLAPLEEQLIGLVADTGRRLSGNVPGLVFTALESVIFLLAYLIVTFYLLLQADQLGAWAAGLIPAPYRSEIVGLGQQIDGVFAAYIRGQLILVVLMSVLLYIPLSILQVPYALVIAITSGILEVIPIVGPWSAAGIAMTAAFFSSNTPFGWTPLVVAAVLGLAYLTLRVIEENFILPQVMGPLVRLHPAVVIFALLAGGAIAGPFGLFISIPVAGVARILLRYIYRKLTDQPEPPTPPSATSLTELAPEPAARGERTEPLAQA